jgi:predicted metal-binding membrane protein
MMVVAMMLPASLPAVRAVSLESMWHRRYRAGGLFAASYLAVWTAFGAIALAAWAAITGERSTPGPDASAVALLIGAVWQLTRWQRRCLKACHRRRPVGARGTSADRACLRYGSFHAAACVGACWPLMLAMVPAHSLGLMASLGALTTWQRRARRPRRGGCAVALGTLAVVAAVVGA